MPIVLWLLFSCLTAQARWATDDDAETRIELDRVEIVVKADGTYVETSEREVAVLKEAARSREGTARLVYNSRAVKLHVLEARTTNDGKVFPVSPELIQDKPLASTRDGFDQLNQATIAYPEVQIGSKLYFKSREEHHEVPFEGFYSETIIHGWNEWIRHSDVTIRSELPLFVAKNDPDGVLKITESRDGPQFVARIQLRKAIQRKVLDEADIHLSGKRLTWVDVSTSQTWSGMAKPVLARYEAIANSDLPPSYARILKAARAKKDPVEQLNTVTSMLAEDVHYWADWRPIRGGHVPRDLATIAKSKFGDCKDFSISTTAILRKLGIEAWPAWIKRSYRPVQSPNQLPTISAFNHAIVRARIGGRDYWIDPTNLASFAQGVFEDIIDRPALVLYPTGAVLENVPPPNPADSHFTLALNVDPREDELPTVGRLAVTGRIGIVYAGDELNRSRESIGYGILRAVADEPRLKSWKFDRFDLTSRVVRDLDFGFRFTLTGLDLRTSAGPGYTLPESGVMKKFQVNLENRVSDLYLAQPYTIQREYVLENVKSPGAARLGCVIDSPWVSATREVASVDASPGVRVVDRYVLKRAMIPIDELRSTEFRDLQAKMRRCFDNVAVVYERPEKP